ncbi:Nucleotidyltransferase [Cristinia sonorae]|uniref:DNA polymerase n=1 Tax=Cristinia sonorae TaxID=1940300 RepID=A0A8K0UUH9_9AGAR|nr:Nucleotidyltransferase [Cristinia sonorae]
MPFKRPGSIPHASSSTYSSASENSQIPAKRTKLTALPSIKVFIVQAKLDSQSIAELFVLAERNCEKLCSDPEEADVIVTAVGMRKRLERHVPWDIAKTKAVVDPDWLRDSVKEGKALPCESYIAIEDLHQETVANCPDCNLQPCGCDDSDEVAENDTPPQTPAKEYPSPPHSEAGSPAEPTSAVPPLKSAVKPSFKGKSRAVSGSQPTSTAHSVKVKIPFRLLAPNPPIPTNAFKLTYKSRYACQRASPLTCPNQKLAVELDIIKRSRALEGEDRSALSYSRAISVIKAYPHLITSRAQAAKLPHIGAKIIGLVEEFLDTGRISEARRISTSTRFQALSAFSSVYGIGPNTARKLHALGLQSLEDLEAYYGVDREEVLQEGQPVQEEGRGPEEMSRPHEKWWPGKDKEKEEDPKKKTLGRGGPMVGDAGSELGESWIRVALGLREDLAVKIPRAEVEEMNKVVMEQLDELEPGCVSTIVGGYRRGKSESNDVDIVFTHPDASKVKGLCKRLVDRLYERGMVTHVMHLSNFHSHNPLRTTHWDSLEKSLTVFILPPSSPYYKENNGHGMRRRLDLIFARPEVYWCAVVGWSGSIMFQRDLRQWAKDKCGMKFDSSGITRRYDSKPFYPKTEKEIFDLFGLEWVDPTMRNADV